MRIAFFLFSLLITSTLFSMKEEEPREVKKTSDGIISRIANSKTNPDTYFGRFLPKNVRETLKLENVTTGISKENKEKALEIFNICQRDLAPVFRGEIPSHLKNDYLDNGLPQNTVQYDFYQILNELHKDNYFYIKQLKTKLKKDLSFDRYLPVIRLFLSDILAQSKIDSTQNKTYKENYIQFLESTPELDQTTILIDFLIRRIGLEALFRKLLVNCFPEASEKLAEALVQEFNDIITAIDNTPIKDSILEYLNTGEKFLSGLTISDKITIQKRNQLISILAQIILKIEPQSITAEQEKIDLKKYVKESKERAKKNVQQEANERKEKILIEKEIEHQNLDVLPRNIAAIQEKSLKDIQNILKKAKKIKLITLLTITGGLLSLSSIMLYLQRNPHLFIQYPFLKKIFPVLAADAAYRKPSLLQQISHSIFKRSAARTK